MTDIANIAAVARREYTFRVRTRSFVIGTIALLVAVVAIALAPVIIRAIDRNQSEGIAFYVAATDLAGDPARRCGAPQRLDRHEAASPDEPPTSSSRRSPTSRLPARRSSPAISAAVLEIDRGADGDLVFTFYTNANPTSPTPGSSARRRPPSR